MAAVGWQTCRYLNNLKFLFFLQYSMCWGVRGWRSDEWEIGMDWIVPPTPNLYAETATPNMTVFRGKVFMEMITGKWWPWSNRISILLRRDRDAKNLLSIPLWPQQEVVICKAVRGFLPGTEPCCYLVSDLLPSGMWDNKWVPSRWRCLNDNKAITGCIILVNFGFPCCKLWVKSYLYLQFADRVSDDSSH